MTKSALVFDFLLRLCALTRVWIAVRSGDTDGGGVACAFLQPLFASDGTACSSQTHELVYEPQPHGVPYISLHLHTHALFTHSKARLAWIGVTGETAEGLTQFCM